MTGSFYVGGAGDGEAVLAEGTEEVGLLVCPEPASLGASCKTEDHASQVGSGETSTVERYALLASALVGHKVYVGVSEHGFAYTDGRAVYVPEGDGQAVLVALFVQSSLLAVGSLDRRTVARLIGRQTPARRYLTLEAARGFEFLRECAPPAVARVVAGHWEGDLSNSPQESLRRALSREVIPDAPDVFGQIRPRRVLHGSALGPSGSPTPDDQHGRTKLRETRELEDDEDSERSRILELFKSVPHGDHPVARFLRDLMGVGRRPNPDAVAEGEGADFDLPAGGTSSVTEFGSHAKSVAGEPDVDMCAPGLGSPADAFYPEWNSPKGAYRSQWCRVGEYAPTQADGDAGSGVGVTDIGPDHRVRRSLARLGLDFERHVRQSEGDDFDLEALVQLAVDRAAGHVNDERVFQARLRTARDLGVLIILDASGSTAEQRPGGRTLWDEQRRVAACATLALDEAGDRVGLYAFRSYGRQDVRFLRLKGFDDRFDQNSRRRLASLEPSGFTRLGAAIRHGSRLVTASAGAKNRLLVLLSDGVPYEDDYTGGYAEQDTQKALGEAVAKGVGCICLSVGSSTTDDGLERVWGNASHARIADLADLRRRLPALEELGQVELRRAGNASRPLSRW